MASLPPFNHSQPRPNPGTPLAFMPPELAQQYMAQGYLAFLTLGAWLWDAGTSLEQEASSLSKRISLANLTYCLSRLCTFAFVISAMIFQVAPLSNCAAVVYAAFAFYTGATAATSFLFLLRVRAIFNRSKTIMGVFGTLWLAIVGSTIPIPFATKAGHIGPTKICTITSVASFGSVIYTVALLIVFDTLVFCTVSWRLGRGARFASPIQGSWLARIRTYVSGYDLPKLTRSLLRGNSRYYLATVGVNLAILILYFAGGISPLFHGSFIVPSTALQNMLACRVFRDTLLDVASVEKQRVELADQNPGHLHFDISLSDILHKNGFSSDDIAISTPSVASASKSNGQS